MALQPIFAAYSEGGNVPVTRGLDYTSPATWQLGAVLVASSGLVVEGGTNPTAIIGVSQQPADTNPGFQAANNPTVVTYRTSKVATAIADRINVFGSQLVNNSSTPIAPVQADMYAQYGLKSYSGVWVVDKNLTTTNARVEIIAIDTVKNLVFFKFLESAIGTP